MSSKFNNKYLLISFAALILLFVFVKFYKSVKTERTLKADIVQLDTAKVSKILLYPESDRTQEIVFVREGYNWMVSSGKISAETDKNAIKKVLAQLIDIKARRLASRAKDKWAEYKVTDSMATRIKVFEGASEKLNLYIGKFTYQQVKDPYGRSSISGTSYVRLAGESEVYAVDGFLSSGFNLPFNKWRNQSIVHLNKLDVTKLTFRYSGDSSFVAELRDKKWTVNNQPIDSAGFVNFLSALSRKNGLTFDDSFSPVGNSQCQVTIEGNNMNTITVDAFEKEKGVYAINSSLNPKSWFLSDSKGVFNDIFKSKKFFIGRKREK